MAFLLDTADMLKRHATAMAVAVVLHVSAGAAIHAGMADVQPPRKEEMRKVVVELITLPRRIVPQLAAAQPQPVKAAPSKPQPQAAAQPAPQPAPKALQTPADVPAAGTAVNVASIAPVTTQQVAEAVAPAAPAAPAPVTAPRFDAAYLNNPKPAYPFAARRLGEEGTVLLHVRVSADGLPVKIEVRTSSGSERLDEAARTAVAQWRFVPARQGDEVVAAWVLVPLVFKMNG